MASGHTGNVVPGNRLRVRVPCPPLPNEPRPTRAWLFFCATAVRRSRRRAMIGATRSIPLFITCAFVAGCGGSGRPPVIKGNELHCDRSIVRDITVHVGNPRKVGKHYFKRDGGMSSDRTSPSDVETWDQAVGVYVFVRTADSDEPKLAVYPKKGGRFGTFGQVYKEWGEFSPREVLTADITSVQLPIHDSIKEYILLMESENEPTGWRVATVPASKITAKGGYRIADLLALPKLEDDKNEAQYRKMLAKHDVKLD